MAISPLFTFWNTYTKRSQPLDNTEVRGDEDIEDEGDWERWRGDERMEAASYDSRTTIT